MSNPYQRVSFEGHTLNTRTVAYVQQVRHVYDFIGGGGRIRIVQGSYNKSVGASAGTHDGGGVLDWAPENGSTRNWGLLLKAARMCGGASFDRSAIAGKWPHHNHTCVIGDKEMAQIAKEQVWDYMHGKNGLIGHAYEPRSVWRPSPVRPFHYPLATIDLSNVRREALKKRGWVAHHGVKVVQRALNDYGFGLVVDGIFGPHTKKAYGHVEKELGGDGDGIPAVFVATLLGAPSFKVKE